MNDKNGFTVINELPLNEFLAYEPKHDPITECVHVVPEFEENQVSVYRHVSKTKEPNERIKTVIENVRGKTSTFENKEIPEINYWCFQGGDGETILTFLTALKCERVEATVDILYYHQNNTQMIEDSDMDNETFQMHYKTENGRENEISINNLYKNVVQEIVNFEE